MTPLSNDELTGFLRYVRKLPDTDAECTTGPGIYYNGNYIFPTNGSDEDLRPVIAWLAETQPPIEAVPQHGLLTAAGESRRAGIFH